MRTGLRLVAVEGDFITKKKTVMSLLAVMSASMMLMSAGAFAAETEGTTEAATEISTEAESEPNRKQRSWRMVYTVQSSIPIAVCSMQTRHVTERVH